MRQKSESQSELIESDPALDDPPATVWRARRKRAKRNGKSNPSTDLGRKRINCTMDRRQYDVIEGALRESLADFNLSDAVRMGLHLVAAVLPLLSRGGQLVFREADGAERAYSVPGKKHGPEAALLSRWMAPASAAPEAPPVPDLADVPSG